MGEFLKRKGDWAVFRAWLRKCGVVSDLGGRPAGKSKRGDVSQVVVPAGVYGGGLMQVPVC